MTVALPDTIPPASVQSRALPLLLRRLASTPLTDLPTLITLLSSTTRLLSSDKLRSRNLSSPSLIPLQLALHLANTSPASLPLPLLLDLTAAYPAHRAAIFQIWSQALSASPPASQSTPGSSDSEDEGNTILGDLIQTHFIPSLISRIQHKPLLQDVGIASTLLLDVIRAHEELLAILLIEADYVLPALKVAYATLNPNPTPSGERPALVKEAVKAKEAILLFCAELIQAVQGDSVRDGLKRLAEVPSGTGGKGGKEGFLRSNTMGEDLLEYLHLGTVGGDEAAVDEEVRTILGDIQDDQARLDPRVQAILALFPSLPPTQLLSALNHPSYATSSTSSPEEQASPLLDVILSGGAGLPSELTKLKQAVQAVSEQQGDISSSAPIPAPTSSTSVTQSSVPPPKAYVRANIHDNAALDMSRLTLRSGTDEPMPLALAPGLGKEVSDEMRASIHRLVERQRVEAEEAARAIAEARGERYRPERYVEDGDSGDEVDDDEDDLGVGAGVKARGIVGLKEGDESGEEENGENIVQLPKPAKGKPQTNGYDVTIQTKLELAYLADVRVFDRDGETRRSAARAKLRQATGMDDSQLEGWRIMLDRNIHKDAILGRHTFVPSKNLDYVMDGQSENGSTGGRSSRGGSRGGRGGRGGSSYGGGDGSSVGGESSGSGRGGGGGGGGRGRGESKGSRGHSNAARTRGHDKKMSRMGL